MFPLGGGQHQEEYRGRFFGTTTLILILFLILFIRVWSLQILNGRKFRAFSEKNRVTIKKIVAMRGRILDRNNIIIADSRPSFDLLLTPSKVKISLHEQLKRMANLLQWDDEELQEVLETARTAPKHDPIIIKRDMERSEVAKILAVQYVFSGIEVVHSPARTYPFGTHGSHYLGYLGEINRNQFKKLKAEENTIYDLGDIWGISGVEKAFEPILRGENGARTFIEDAWGREIREEFSEDLLPGFRPKESIPGQDLVLTIDTRVQEAAERAFTHEGTGAVVAMDPTNGDILALVSRPEYAPGNFVRGVSSQYWKELLADPLNPLYDRALRGLYPPASTFKMIMAAAALEKQIINPAETVYCPGYYRIGRETKRCWKGGGHGAMNLRNGIKQSCDVYFYEVGKRLGIEEIAKMAKSFGLGRLTGIGINREEKGLVPTEAWKKKVYRQPWVGGETLSVAIGQGALQTTPIQMVTAYSALVNGGTIYRPRIMLQAQTEGGEVTHTFKIEPKESVFLSQENRDLIVDALGSVVNEPGGTAYWSARSKLIEMGGKTGTAQVVGRRSGLKVEDHAWFIGFAPIQNPKIVVAVIVEHGGHGGSTAGPIVRQIIEAYLEGTS